jgi:hypothetical protein
VLARIFPKQIDNTYRGYKTAIVVLFLVAGLKATQGTMSMLNARQTITGADGIPLDTFSPESAQVIVRLFTLAGLNLLILPLLSLIVLVRYRGMIPLLLLIWVGFQLASRVVVLLVPSANAGGGMSGAALVNLGILMLTLIGFGLSVSTPRSKVQLSTT